MVDMTTVTPQPIQEPRLTQRGRRWFIGIAVLAALVVGSVFAFVTFQPIQVLPRVRLAPGFSLVDSQGRAMTSEDMRGQFVLYTFSYSSCVTCDSTDQTMKEVQEGLASADLRGFDVALVTISVDPLDTPESMASYAESVGADPEVWAFATVEDPRFLADVVAGGFSTYFSLNDDGTITLDRRFVLVDGAGIIRNEYKYETQTSDTDRILRHLGVLAEEEANSNGPAGLAYEAAHLFLCYAP
ncbi:MAG: SCO family protein [Acidimicrobiia bacterium]|nr:SCO family protein [Acidimicrobiia bacterium]